MPCVLLICGGRDLDEDKVFCYLQENVFVSKVFRVIAGGAKGADKAAIRWAKHNQINHTEFLADWEKFGNKAGPIRNVQMLKEGKPDIVIAFPGSVGTAHMVSIAKAKGVPVIQIEGNFEMVKKKTSKSRWNEEESAEPKKVKKQSSKEPSIEDLKEQVARLKKELKTVKQQQAEWNFDVSQLTADRLNFMICMYSIAKKEDGLVRDYIKGLKTIPRFKKDFEHIREIYKSNKTLSKILSKISKDEK